MFRKLLSGLALAAALVLTTAPANAADKLKVALDWFVNPDHATLVLCDNEFDIRGV